MASEIINVQPIQTLWSGYGQILRFELAHTNTRQHSQNQSVVVKVIQPPDRSNHPRGWNTDASMRRKIQSYRVEANWYQHYAKQCNTVCKVPLLFRSQVSGSHSWLILEDLDQSFPMRYTSLTPDQCQACLSWLARFHAHHLHSQGSGLWPTGTYWHLQTRAEEFEAMPEGELKDAAELLDARLAQCRFQTLVHGDAKVANICFPQNSSDVAMVDFQYTGRGCGIRDVAYFLGSCLDERQCERHAEQLLEGYFEALGKCLAPDISEQVRGEWHSLYAIAWADFHRFLAGWMPGHKKINRYTQRLTRQALEQL